eukprot:SAG31_NODE_8603_length_1422_cov_1.000000_2_plen_133_part_00
MPIVNTYFCVVPELSCHLGHRRATFVALGGAHAFDFKAATHGGLPPIDAKNMWPTIAQGTASPRAEIMLSEDAFIAWPYKVVTGKQGGKGIWTGQQSPNATKVKDSHRSNPDFLSSLSCHTMTERHCSGERQ